LGKTIAEPHQEMPQSMRKLVFLGVGQVAHALARKACGLYELHGTTRSAEHRDIIRAHNVEPLVVSSFSGSEKHLSAILDDAFVVVSFPPDPLSDEAAAALASKSARVVYISSTSVYGRKAGDIDESTAVDDQAPHAKARLDAERIWQSMGASVIRSAGIYGRGNGLHHRLMSGSYRLPGDGSNYVSRIHVDDLSSMIMRLLESDCKSEVYLSGDERPSTHLELVEWLVAMLGVPFPESVPLESCHYTQQGNRRIDATKIRADLKFQLEYPTYMEGYAEELRRMQA